MSTLDEEFSLDDEERQVIGEQIKDLDQDAFDKWFKAFNVFAKGKNKKMMEEKMKMEKGEKEKMDKEGAASSGEIEKSAEVIASEQEEKQNEAAEVLEKVEAKDSEVPNGSVAEDSLRQKFAKAFNSETVKIELTK
jgi:hypothetical protein